MTISVEVDQAIKSATPFDVTLSVGDGDEGVFVMTLEVNHVARPFALQLGTLPKAPSAASQSVAVEDENTWTVSDWGNAATGDLVDVKLTEKAPGARSGSGSGAVTP